MARQMVTIRHPEIDGPAVVPETALAHMDPRWEVVDTTAEPAVKTAAPRKPRKPRKPAANRTQTPADVAGSTTENQE